MKHHGYKGDPAVTPGSCSAVGERAQVILVWVRASDVGNALTHGPRNHKGKAIRYVLLML